MHFSENGTCKSFHNKFFPQVEMASKKTHQMSYSLTTRAFCMQKCATIVAATSLFMKLVQKEKNLNFISKDEML